MQTLKYFFAILRQHIMSVLIFAGIFVGLAIFLTQADGESIDEFSSANINLTIINRDNHPISQSLYDHMASLHTMIEIEDDLETKQMALFFTETTHIIIIENGFGAAFYENPTYPAVQLETLQSSNSMIVAPFIDMQVDSFMRELRAYLTGGFEMSRAIALAGQSP
ncbi:MAG: hypothetical protein FWC67_03435, partial [Defluviitaleaceae bacterium]|nr:hypothetical protein [Defluviitaleaceae bacterium]